MLAIVKNRLIIISFLTGLLGLCLTESYSTIFHVSVLCSLAGEVLLLFMLGMFVYLTARKVIRVREEIAPNISGGDNIGDISPYQPHPYLRRSLSHHLYTQASREDDYDEKYFVPAG